MMATVASETTRLSKYFTRRRSYDKLFPYPDVTEEPFLQECPMIRCIADPVRKISDMCESLGIDTALADGTNSRRRVQVHNRRVRVYNQVHNDRRLCPTDTCMATRLRSSRLKRQ